MSESDGPHTMDTVTHARIRARQGDVRGAIAILARVLSAEPGRVDARELLASLDPGNQRESEVEPDHREPPPSPAAPAALRTRFRAALARDPGDRRTARLRAMLHRIEAVRAGEPVPRRREDDR